MATCCRRHCSLRPQVGLAFFCRPKDSRAKAPPQLAVDDGFMTGSSRSGSRDRRLTPRDGTMARGNKLPLMLARFFSAVLGLNTEDCKSQVLGGGVILPPHVQERHRSGVTDRFRFVVFVHFDGSAFFANPRDFPWERSQPASARRTRRVAHSSDEFRLDCHMDFKIPSCSSCRSCRRQSRPSRP